jgi:hypothetical protein
VSHDPVADAVVAARSLLEAGALELYLVIAEDGRILIDREAPHALIVVVVRSLDQVRRFAEGARADDLEGGC